MAIYLYNITCHKIMTFWFYINENNKIKKYLEIVQIGGFLQALDIMLIKIELKCHKFLHLHWKIIQITSNNFFKLYCKLLIF